MPLIGCRLSWDERRMLRERLGHLAAASGCGAQERRAIDAAMARVDQPGFGACAGCGAPIAWERLLDTPYRAHCTRCETPATDRLAGKTPAGRTCAKPT